MVDPDPILHHRFGPGSITEYGSESEFLLESRINSIPTLLEKAYILDALLQPHTLPTHLRLTHFNFWIFLILLMNAPGPGIYI